MLITPSNNNLHTERKSSLGIVVTHATQFDGPLFRFLTEKGGFDLTVYFTRPGGHALSRDQELGTEMAWDNDVCTGYQSYTRKRGLFGHLDLLRRILNAGHEHIVVSGYSPITHLVVAFLARLHGESVGLRSDTILLYGQPTGMKKFLKDLILPWILKVYATGHPTGSLAADYLRHHGMSSKELFLFPYNVDNDWLVEKMATARGERESLRHQYGIPPAAPTVLGIMKFVSREDPMTLFSAFQRMRNRVPDAHLVLVGDGALRPLLMAEIKRAELDECIHLPGYLAYSELPRHYAMADIFVHPAAKEQWGVSVNEAMICGVAVVTSSNVGAAQDLIEDGVSGFVFRVGDDQDLAEKLVQLATSEGLRDRVVEAARRTIQCWHYRETAKQLEQAVSFITGARYKANAGEAP